MMRINNRNHYLRVICLYLQPGPVPRVPLISPRARDELHHHQSPALQPVISDIYHIHYDHNATVGTRRFKREMARTILCLLKPSGKLFLVVSECKPVCLKRKNYNIARK